MALKPRLQSASSMANTFSPFLKTAYTALLATTIQKIEEIHSFLRTLKLRGYSDAHKTLDEIDDVVVRQGDLGSNTLASDCDGLYKRRLRLGRIVASMAMMDAVYDNYIFALTLVSKRADVIKERLECFDPESLKKGNGDDISLKGDGKIASGDDKEGSDEWIMLMEMVQQVAAETGKLANKIDGIDEFDADLEPRDDNGTEDADEKKREHRMTAQRSVE